MASNNNHTKKRPLPNGKVSAEDVRKCGEEIKQLRNQQLLIGTTAVGLFGAYAAVLTRFSSRSPSSPDLYIWTGVAWLVVFTFLFFWTRKLRELIGVISVWLELAGESTWEHDHRMYQERYKTVSQTQLVSIAFLVIGAGVAVLVFFMSPKDDSSTHSWKWFLGILAVLLYFWIISEFGIQKQGIDENTVRNNWLELIPDIEKGDSRPKD
jgi:hypothetical protein